MNTVSLAAMGVGLEDIGFGVWARAMLVANIESAMGMKVLRVRGMERNYDFGWKGSMLMESPDCRLGRVLD